MDLATLTRALEHAKSGQWIEARVLLKSMESGTEWSDDAPPSALLLQDGLLVSASLACTEARLMPASDGAYWTQRAILLIEELLGDNNAADARATLEANGASVARLELGLHPDREEWL